MSYAATTIVVWGIRVNEDIAEKIYNELTQNDDSEAIINMEPSDRYLRKMTSNYKRNIQQKYYNISPYSQHDSGYGSEVFEPRLFSDGTDSRIDSLTFDLGYNHVLGIYVASKGYAYNDKIESFIKSVPQEAKNNFEKYIKPILDKYNIKEQPDIVIVNQTW